MALPLTSWVTWDEEMNLSPSTSSSPAQPVHVTVASWFVWILLRSQSSAALSARSLFIFFLVVTFPVSLPHQLF